MHEVVVEEHERADRNHSRVEDDLLDMRPPVENLVRHGDINQSLGVPQRLFGLVPSAWLGSGLKDPFEDILGGLPRDGHETGYRISRARRLPITPVRASRVR